MRRLALAALLLSVSVLPGRELQAAPPERPAKITKAELRDMVKFLADDELEGREAGEPGCDRAADFIAAEFQRLGLEPVGDGGTFFQNFSRPRGMKVLPTTALAVVNRKGNRTDLELGTGFAPHDLSSAGEVTAPGVFAGYGISAPDIGYDDYAGLDVRGKVVVILRHAPGYTDRKSPFSAPAAMQRHATFQAKVDAAATRNAAALIIVNDPETFARKSADRLKPPGGTSAGKLPVMHVTWQAGRKFGSRLGVPLQRRQKQIDGKIQPRSHTLDVDVHVKCDLERDQREMKNIVALLRPEAGPTTGADGAAPSSAETVVMGAHYDHVGRGRFGSLANANGEIHNGADDNGSGTSSLLEAAGFLSERRGEMRRPILFIAFSGEELGLWGSKHYVASPIVPLAQTVAMINLDMVGRLTKNRLFVGGTGTSPVWPGLIDALNKDMGRFELTKWPGGKAPSDHTSFYERDIPVLFFFTGLHEDYHRPSDDWKTLNYAGQERIAHMAALVALDQSSRAERPPFTRCDAGGFTVGPYTGLAIEQREDGIYVAHVDKKSPARKAGFRVDDKLLEWNGVPVPDTNRFNDLISRAKPGETADVVVERSGRKRKLKLKLGST